MLKSENGFNMLPLNTISRRGRGEAEVAGATPVCSAPLRPLRETDLHLYAV